MTQSTKNPFPTDARPIDLQSIDQRSAVALATPRSGVQMGIDAGTIVITPPDEIWRPSDMLERLAAPFPASAVEWRVGSTTKDKKKGMALAYIDARDVQDRLDAVCGVYWQVKHHNCGGDKLACEIGIKISEEWLWRGDGAGSTDVEAEKGAFSDSFKRAGVRWGIGRYLYELSAPWVELEPRGNSFVIAKHEFAKLDRLLGGDSRKPEIAAETPAVPAGADLWQLAHDAAQVGSDALRVVWVELGGTKQKLLCARLRADPKKGCPASLKLLAEEADKRKRDTSDGGGHAEARSSGDLPTDSIPPSEVTPDYLGA